MVDIASSLREDSLGPKAVKNVKYVSSKPPASESVPFSSDEPVAMTSDALITLTMRAPLPELLRRPTATDDRGIRFVGCREVDNP